MSVIQLKGTRRESIGKGGARKARAAGQIPAVLYGHGETPVPVAINRDEFQAAVRHHKGGNAIVNLNIGGPDVTTLVRDVQYDPVSHVILHLDFQHISLSEMIEVEVPLHLIGLALGVREGGGLVEHITRQIEIRCLPTAIPSHLDVDITELALGESLHVRDLKIEGYTVLTHPDITVAAVVAPAAEEVAAVPVEGVAAAAEPEVVSAKGKKEEGGAEPVAEKGKEGKEKGKDKDKDKGKDKDKDKDEKKEKKK